MSVDVWLEIYERWAADPDPANDAGWVEQLAGVAILHRLPCYENGVDDAGTAGWRRLVERYRGEGVYQVEVKLEATNDKRQTTNTGYVARPLPWAAG